MPANVSPPAAAAPAAQAFRRFFAELRDIYIEREALFTQIELALLCREHVLVVGPPGTAKSAIAAAVLARIVDQETGAPSLFAKQLSESTVQTDLIGPVDFKVLTETGRTQYLTDDGMLGATYGFLDEVFDGRDMLLRSILNVLHERELKHGRQITPGALETAIMTSNRYLSEVLGRSPELLLAFADRLSFVCFVPKSFARPSSRAAMMQRFARGQRPELRAELTIQQLDALQAQVEGVEIPSTVMEAIELLTDHLERLLQAQVAKLPDYVPTKYFSQRSVVKAMWALKAAVVRDGIWRHMDRPLEATEADLEMLRHFFLLGGPPPQEAEAMLKAAVDPRERAQLEILRLEHRAFDEALAKVRAGLAGGVEREASTVKAQEELTASEGLSRSYTPSLAVATARSLRSKLVPGPRHMANRAPLVAAARALATAVEQRLGRGVAGQGEGRGGAAVAASFAEVLDLCRAVPELADVAPALASRMQTYAQQALEVIGLGAEGIEFDDTARLDALTALAGSVEQELSELRELCAAVESAAGGKQEALRAKQEATRQRVVASIRRKAASAFEAQKPRKGVEAYEALTGDSRRLAQLETRLVALSPDQKGLREELLGPLGAAYAQQVLDVARFEKLEQLATAVRNVAEGLRAQGIDPVRALAASKEILEERIQAHVRDLAEERPLSSPDGAAVLNGEAYSYYRSELTGSSVPEGELAALLAIEAQLAEPGNNGKAAPALSPALRDGIAQAELAALHQRISFLRGWVAQLVQSLPEPGKIRDRAEAERAFDKLVKSRFPMLAMKEGELVRLQGALAALARQPGQVGEGAQALEKMLRSLSETFAIFSKRLLETRAAL